MYDQNCTTDTPFIPNDDVDTEADVASRNYYKYRDYQGVESKLAETVRRQGPYRFLLTMTASPSIQRKDFEPILLQYLARLGEWLSWDSNYFYDVFDVTGVAVYEWPGKVGSKFAIYVGIRDNPLLSRDDQEATGWFLKFLTSSLGEYMDSCDEDEQSGRPEIVGLQAHANDVVCESVTSFLRNVLGKKTRVLCF